MKEELKKIMEEINSRKQPYKLVDVQNHERKTKVQERELYVERINCITDRVNLPEPIGEKVRASMAFVLDGNNQVIYRRLHTSYVENIIDADKKLELHTKNSIYIFEEVELPKEKYLNTADLIELYLTDEHDKFMKGFYYDKEKKRYELYQHINVGTFVDTSLIGIQTDELLEKYVCRYYIKEGPIIEMYDTLYGQQPYMTEMLIHNESDQEMTVKFPNGTVWKIPERDSYQGRP